MIVTAPIETFPLIKGGVPHDIAQRRQIIQSALKAAQPDTAVRKALAEADFGAGKLLLVAAGKAAWQMAKTAVDALSLIHI